MPWDPIVLGGAKVLWPIFQTCETLYKQWQTGKAFNKDFEMIDRKLYAQYTIFAMTGQTQLSQLACPIDPDNIEHPQTKAIYGVLLNIQSTYTKIDELIKGYVQERKKLRKKRPDTDSISIPASSSRTGAVTIEPITPNPAASDTATENISSATSARASSLEGIVSTKPKNMLIRLLPKKHRQRFIKSADTPATIDVRNPQQMDDQEKISVQPDASDQVSSVPGKTAPSLDSQSAVILSHASTVLRQTLEDRPHDVLVSSTITDKAIHNADFWDKWQWAREDRPKLLGYIKELESYNRTLRELTALQPLSNSAAFISESQSSLDNLREAVTRTQSVITRLHCGLRGINTADEPCWLPIQLTTDFAEQARTFEHNELPARYKDGKFMYVNFQRSKTRNGDDPVLFVAQSLLTEPTQDIQIPAGLPNVITSFEHADYDQESPQEGFVHFGIVAQDAGSEDYHRLFRDARNRWKCCGTLGSSLRATPASSEFTPYQRVELAYIVTASYLYFSGVIANGTQTTLDSFLYFTFGDEEVSWFPDAQILNPYLLCDFGRKSTAVVGRRPQRLDIVMELALILAQIGCGTVRDDSAPTSGNALSSRRWISRHLDELNAINILYTEIVQHCAEYKVALLPGQDKQNAQQEFLLRTMTRLSQLSSQLRDSPAGGFM